MNYRTDREFKKAVEKSLDVIISSKAWALLSEVLFAGAIHEPYSDGDVEFAVKKFENLRRMEAI